MTQLNLSKETNFNRALISQLENKEFTPSANQLMALATILNFDINSVFEDSSISKQQPVKSYKIAVAGTDYVGLSLAVRLFQHNYVNAFIIQDKVDNLNNFISPIQDENIEKYLNEAKNGKHDLKLKASVDGAKAYNTRGELNSKTIFQESLPSRP